MSPLQQLAGGAAWLAARAHYAAAAAQQSYTPTMTGGSSGTMGIFQAAGANNQTNTAAFINELRFAAAKSIRTSTIILAAFNAVAAFSTAFGILYDGYQTKKRHDRRYRISSGQSFVQTSDVYPLVLSIGITIQGIGFAAAQAKGLDGLLVRGCTLASQFMLPAVFIVPYIQLVFAGEITLRALRRKPFPSRGKWTITICLVVVGALILANFLVADFVRSPDLCFASLFWFVRIYAEGCFAILLTISVLLALCMGIIFIRLSRNINIETAERMCASRMVYYLALGVLSNTLMAPFFYSLGSTSANDPNNQVLNLSMVASVVANVSGLMTGGLYLFLRSNTLSTIGPKNKAGEYERTKIKHQIRRFGPSDGGGSSHMMRPVNNSAMDLRRMLSDASLISSHYDKDEEATLVSRGSPTYDILGSRRNPLRSHAVYPADDLVKPQPAQVSRAASNSSSRSARGKSPHSFLNGSAAADTKSITVLPATIYTPGATKNINRFDFSTLKPPPSMKNLTIGRHRRDSSMASHATVQIGLRLSNVEDMPPMQIQEPDKKVYTLQCPIEAAPDAPKRPSPLAAVPIPDETASISDNESLRRDPVRDARMKTLPPVPRPGESKPAEEPQQEPPAEESSGPTLSPTVYNPQSPTKTAKLPSPRVVGFSPPPRSNSQTARSPPPRLNSNGSPRHIPAASGKAGDWI